MSNPRIRVAHITEATQGGVLRQLEWAAQALPSRDIDLHFVLSFRQDSTRTRALDLFRQCGVTVHEVSMQRAPCPFRDWHSYRQLRDTLQTIQPDLVHTHSSKAGILGRRAAYRLRIPCIHTPHVFAFEWAGTSLSGTLYRYAEQMAARWCEKIILLSDAQKEETLRARIAPEKKLTVIPNGINPNAFPPATPTEKVAARAAFQIPDAAIALGTAARLEPQKGMGVFLRAAALVKTSHPHVLFLIAGEGTREPEYRRQAEQLGLTNTVRFCGAVEHMKPFYHALDGFVLASLWEGLPYVILEAQAAGLPVVAARTRGADAAIEDGRTGLLAPVGDETALAEAIDSMLDDKGLADRLARAGHETVNTDFTLDVWADRLAGLYHELTHRDVP